MVLMANSVASNPAKVGIFSFLHYQAKVAQLVKDTDISTAIVCDAVYRKTVQSKVELGIPFAECLEDDRHMADDFGRAQDIYRKKTQMRGPSSTSSSSSSISRDKNYSDNKTLSLTDGNCHNIIRNGVCSYRACKFWPCNGKTKNDEIYRDIFKRQRDRKDDESETRSSNTSTNGSTVKRQRDTASK
eukprot:GHVQ01028844.1.p1 GENE.GHVQ01028844.1~~GHVQ01028844.1.p1  ORF type:complete len:187 (+),score=9.54 GHVQ01028844.1:996-1556(+)